jgi:hypothetical protein
VPKKINILVLDQGAFLSIKLNQSSRIYYRKTTLSTKEKAACGVK